MGEDNEVSDDGRNYTLCITFYLDMRGNLVGLGSLCYLRLITLFYLVNLFYIIKGLKLSCKEKGKFVNMIKAAYW